MSSTMRTRIWSAIWLSFFYLAMRWLTGPESRTGAGPGGPSRPSRRRHGRGCGLLLFVLLSREDRFDELRTEDAVAVDERLEDDAGRPRGNGHDRLSVLVDEVFRGPQRERDRAI